MKSVIVGTAGHIDHGKTALVKALTGIDADRLEEEKRRGITIDIGFAHLELTGSNGEKLRLGFVDVPGHERFVRNMLAGIGGIDVVLLVIAADESIMPQTREHFDICRMLSVRRGITVLTKSDTVDVETLDVVKLEVEDFLRGSFLDPNRAESGSEVRPSREDFKSSPQSVLSTQHSANRGSSAISHQPSAKSEEATNPPHSPIIAVSSLTGAGVPELKQALARIAAEVPARDSSALARLPIDRVFTMKGFGTVITGTLVSGTIRKEDELEVFPIGKRVRVRGVQVHGESAEKAVAGQRTALNLAGVTVEELSRGMMLAPAETFRTTKRIDTRLSLLPGTKPLKQGARVHFHSYTMEAIAEVRLFDGKELRPGDEQWVQLRLSEPALLLRGDRFIVRQFSPLITIGGGFVLDAFPPVRTRAQRDVAAFLTKLTEGSPEEVMAALVRRRNVTGLPIKDLSSEMNIRLEEARRMATRAPDVRLFDDVLVSGLTLNYVVNMVLEAANQFHSANPLVPGISREELRERANGLSKKTTRDRGSIAPEIFRSVLQSLAERKAIEISGELVRLPGRGVVMKDEEAESKKIIEQAFASAGLQVPALYTVLAGLKVDKTRAQKIVTLLLRDKTLVKISEELVFHHSALANLREQLAAYKAKSTVAGVAKIDVGKFKEMTGVSRKYAIPLLEYLDRERVTRRVGDERIIL
jgi:selenocysteine-specific elongation factor